MMDDLSFALRVGGTLRLEDEDGNVVTYTVRQIMASLPAIAPDWTTNSPNVGRVTLTLHPEDLALPALPEVN